MKSRQGIDKLLQSGVPGDSASSSFTSRKRTASPVVEEIEYRQNGSPNKRRRVESVTSHLPVEVR